MPLAEDLTLNTLQRKINHLLSLIERERIALKTITVLQKKISEYRALTQALNKY